MVGRFLAFSSIKYQENWMNGYLANKLSCWHRIRISQGEPQLHIIYCAAKDKDKDNTLRLFCISLVLPPFCHYPLLIFQTVLRIILEKILNALTCEFSRCSGPFFPLLLTAGRLSKKQTVFPFKVLKKKLVGLARGTTPAQIAAPSTSLKWAQVPELTSNISAVGTSCTPTALVQRTGINCINWHLLFPRGKACG